MEIEDKIILTINRIRPYIQGDGGDIEFVSFDKDTGVVMVKLLGACVGCSLIDFTLKGGVEALLMDEIPEVTEVIEESTYLYGT
ncbi:MAG: NifU family protein [Erysipelothrix sp.]|nr:NifU family protein [Erysipelothrix sp.]